MTFDFSVDGILVPVYDGANFNEQNLTIVGINDATVTQSGGQWTVDVTTSSFSLEVEDGGVLEHSSVSRIDFATGLTANSGAGGEVSVVVNESELTTFVHLTGDEEIDGNKTFTGDIVINNLTTTGTVTYLNTEELFVEDNIIVLNSTVSGTPSLDSGIEIERGTSANAQLLWRESLDRFVVGISGSFTGDDQVIVIRSELLSASGALLTNINSRVLRAGDTMTGNLSFASGIDILSAASGTSDIGTAAAPFAQLFVNQGFNYSAPTLAAHIANKAYVDAQISSASVEVQENDVTVTGSASTINFDSGFDVVNDGGGKVTISLDAEGQFMNLTTAQTASGVKTFASGIILGSLSEPATATGTGTTGDFRWANDFLYICVATNTWRRVAVAIF